MNITLNIGLEVSKHYLPEGVAGMQLQYKHVREQLEKALGTPLCIGLARSATEKTVVAQYTDTDVQAVLRELYQLAHDLGQDCIAYSMQYEGNVLGGALVGKYAHEWNYGVFSKEYFIPAGMNLKYRRGEPL